MICRRVEPESGRLDSSLLALSNACCSAQLLVVFSVSSRIIDCSICSSSLFKAGLPIVATKVRAKIRQLLVESLVVAIAGQTYAQQTTPEEFYAGV